MTRRAVAGRVAVASVVGATALGAAPASAAPSARLTTGFSDAFLGGDPHRTDWLGRMRTTGAREIRVSAAWSAIAPAAPPSDAQAVDPGWSGYRFGGLDEQVRLAVAAGLRPMVMGFSAPAWAEGSGRRAGAPEGTWRPDAAAYGRFMRAVARRYDGTFPDPVAPGATLPAVAAFQVWNEPNLSTYLTPQWNGRRPASPATYRALQNAAYAGVKAAQPAATVVTAGDSPFGDAAVGSSRMQPARFWREVLCLDASLRRSCRTRTSLDVISHHPYPTSGAPAQRTRSRDDISIADLSKLVRIAAAATRNGTLRPRTPALWVTEFAIRSTPPAAVGRGRSLPAQARYIAESTWRLWRQGVSRLFFFSVNDLAPRGPSTILTGLGVYREDGTPKPAQVAARFPTFAYPSAGRRLAVWTRPPEAGRLRIQVRRGGRWSTAGVVAARADAPLTVRVAARSVTAVRATLGGSTSYTWRVR